MPMEIQGHDLGQAIKCGRINLVNKIRTLCLLIIRSPTAIHIHVQCSYIQTNIHSIADLVLQQTLNDE